MTLKLHSIKTPSKGTLSILRSRLSLNERELPDSIGAVGLVQGLMIEMICAADIAEKTAGVKAMDVRGSCPQNMVLLAIFGDTASVEEALKKIKKTLNDRDDKRC